jgi:predicted Zn-dependent peptidase
VIAIAGNVDSGRVLDELNDIFKEFTPEGSPNRDQQLLTITRNITNYKKNLEQIHFCFGTKGLCYSHIDRYVLYLLNIVLGGGMSSRLFQEIREKRGLVYAIYSFYNSYRPAGLFGVYGGTSPNTYRTTIELIQQEFLNIKNQGITEEELKRAKEQLKGSLLLSLENTKNRMSRLARSELYFGRIISIEEMLQGIEEVRVEDVQGLAQELFDTKYFNIAAIGQIKKEDEEIELIC